MLPLVVTPPPSSSSPSSNSDVISPSDEAPLVLPWRDAWDLDDPFPANSSDAIYSRWTEGPTPQVFGSKSTKISNSNGNSGGGNGGKWTANTGPRAKALDVLAMVDNAAAAVGATSSSPAGSALDAFSSFSSSTSSGTSSSVAPPPPPSQKARGKWARAAGFGKGGSRGGGFGSSSRRGSSHAGTYHAQEEASGGARARTARGLLDDDLGVLGAAAARPRLGPSEELEDQAHQPEDSAAGSFSGPGGGKEEPTFVVPASFVSPYVKSWSS